jgi:V/A-type H+-transporting ATPase subunit K
MIKLPDIIRSYIMDFGTFGAAIVMGISGLGSAVGIAIAGQAAIGAWKRCYMNNKPAPFILTVFAGAPLTQTIYGFLLMQTMISSSKNGAFLLGLGIASGISMCSSAIAQGQAGAAASDALGETGKGFAQYIMVVGLCETVALFTMVFSMIVC